MVIHGLMITLNMIFFSFYFASKRVLSTCMSVCCVCFWCLMRPEEDVESPGTGIISSCKLLCGCWDLNLIPLEEQPMLLSAEPSLHPLNKYSCLVSNDLIHK